MDSLNAAMIEVGRRLWVRGYVAANDGNLSVRLDAERFLTTATGSIKGFLTEEDLVVIDGRGHPLDGSSRRPSSEIRMHLAIYEARPDIGAVVHAHPPTATGFATAGVALDACVLPEIVATLGRIPTVPYGTPSTPELSAAVGAHAARGNALLLANHGAVTFAGELFEAYYHMERTEHYARILLAARQLGNVQRLTDDQVQRLHEAFGSTPDLTCATCGEATRAGEPHTCVPDAIGVEEPGGHAEPGRRGDVRGAGDSGGGGAAERRHVDRELIERITRALRAVIEEERTDGSGTHR